MTRSEAISLIKSAQLMLINPTTNEPVSDLYAALEMAIQALSQEPTNEKELNKAYTFGHNRGVKAYYNEQLCTVELPEAVFRYILSLVPTEEAEQEPCDECKYFDGNSCQHYDYKVGYTQGYEDASNRFRQEPCDDAISRREALNCINDTWGDYFILNELFERIDKLPSVTQKSNTGHCKECKYFEYDSVGKVDGMPLIVAHEICNKWGDGCKTSEDGYCYLFEPQESEE